MSRFDAFLIGIIVMSAITAGTFFLRFWKRTGDVLFGAFAAFFFVEAIFRVAVALSPRPNEGELWSYLLLIGGYAVLLLAIANKNFNRRG